MAPSYAGKLLYVGLPPDSQGVKQSGIDPELVRKGIAATTDKLRSAGYANFEFFPVDPEEADWRERLEQALRREQVAGVCIGAGVRMFAAQTLFFEQLVQLIVRTSPSTILCFNSDPPSTMAAIERNFPLSE